MCQKNDHSVLISYLISIKYMPYIKAEKINVFIHIIYILHRYIFIDSLVSIISVKMQEITKIISLLYWTIK